jgi:hypothetical protein
MMGALAVIIGVFVGIVVISGCHNCYCGHWTSASIACR